MSDRHQFRAKWHDYNGGIYFITICAHEKRHIFGRIYNTCFTPSMVGQIIDQCINTIHNIHPHAEVWNYVIMPNHIHMVLSVGAQYIAPTSDEQQFIASTSDKQQFITTNTGCLKPPMHGEAVSDNHFNSKLAVIVRTFKAAVTRITRAQCIAPLPHPIWQRNYHEHIIRNQRAFDNIMSYIDSNIENWSKDCFA